MSTLTSSELSLLRTRPHRTKLWLSIYQPKTVLAGTVNDASIGKGARTITYTASSGSYSSIEDGMTLLVGTSAGAADVGRIRVRSATSTELTVAENSHINWQNGLHLTVQSFYEVWPVYPRLVQDGENVTFYKDYDIPYSNQNEILGTFVCMGPHHAAFLEGGQARVYFTAEGTTNLLGESLTYAWEFEGGSPATSSAQAPGYVTWTAPGHYTVKLTVTSASGAVDVSYRHVSIYERPGAGSFTPILKWELLDLNGSRETGGYRARIRIYGTLPQIIDGSLVVIFADDWYGSTKQSIGGNATGRQSIVFTGYVLDGSVRYDYHASQVEFEVGSVTEMMKECQGFAVSVESKASPSTWYELLDMDVRRALYHYLRWHSTVLKVADFEFVGNDRKIQYFDSNRESLYDAVNTLMRGALWGSIVADRQGKIWAETEVAAIHNATSNLTQTFSLAKQDWMGEPDVTVRTKPELSYLSMGGIAFSGTATGTYSAYMACAPGTAPHYRGKVEQYQGLALESQTQLNQLVGDVFAWRNSRYPDITFTLAGNYRNLDIAPQEIVGVNIDANDTNLGITLTDEPFTMRSMRWKYDGRREAFWPRVSLAQVTSGIDGDTIIIPDVPPDGGHHDRPEPPPIIIPTIDLNLEGARILSNNTQTIPAGTSPPGNATTVVFDSVVYDLGGFWRQSTPSEIHIPSGGVYAIFWQLNMDTTSVDNIYILLTVRVNGVDRMKYNLVVPMLANYALYYTFVNIACYRFNAGDRITFVMANYDPNQYNVNFTSDLTVQKISSM